MNKPVINGMVFMGKKATIITVCLNAEETIERTIQSVIGRRSDLEYIVIDGSSTDHTIDIVRKYEDQIDVIISEQDQGIYDAMNKGVERASGDWISFLNSGDTYYDGYYEMLDQIETTDEIVYGNITVSDVGIKAKESKPFAQNEILFRMFCCHQAVIARKDLFEKVGFFDGRYRVAADYDWLLRAYLSGCRFRYEDRVFAHYLGGGVSEKNYTKYSDESVKIIRSNLRNNKRIEDVEYSKVISDLCDWKIMFRIRADLDDGKGERLIRTLEKEMQVAGYKGVALWGLGKWGMRFAGCLIENKVPIEHFIDRRAVEAEIVGARIVSEYPECLRGYKGIIVVSSIDERIVEEIKNSIKQEYSDETQILTLQEIGKKAFEEETVKLMEYLKREHG